MKEVDDKPWLGEKNDTRSLWDLAQLWYKLHGQHLKSGAITLRRLEMAITEMGDPLAARFSAKDFVHWRAGRTVKVHDQATDKPVAPKTNNMDQSALSAIFNELIALDEWKLPNPLAKVKRLPIPESEMAYLTDEDLHRLFTHLSGSKRKQEYGLICKICLSTGARISEAIKLKTSQVTPYKITYTNTKSHKNRTVPISKKLYEELNSFERIGESERYFSDCLESIRYLVDKVFPDLPVGQNTHAFRHTFASRFMHNGGNILALQRILGHSDINMTMRYAHFSPDHLIQAVEFNPITSLGL
jgi:integrase